MSLQSEFGGSSKSDASAPVVFDGEYAMSQEDIRRTWRRAPYDCHAPGSEVVAYQQQETTVIAHPMSAIKSRLRQTIGSARFIPWFDPRHDSAMLWMHWRYCTWP